MRSILLIILVVCSSVNLMAQQDRHFSMFYASPIELNPGATGVFEGDVQFFTNYRNQWSKVTPKLFKTISASIDGKLKKMRNGNFFGGGVNIYNDVAGDGRLKTNVYRASMSYAIEVEKDQFLSLGVQPSLFQRTLNKSDLTWSNQWTGTEFNIAAQSGEAVSFGNIATFDINAGLYYYGRVNEYALVKVGVAAHHLTAPNISFVGADEKLYRKYVVNAGLDYMLSHSKLGIAPNVFFFQQGPNSEITFGTDFKYYVKESSRYTSYYDETSVSLGVYYRNRDAFYTTLFFNTAGVTFGVSYDANISGLKTATSGLGGLEFLLRYRLGFSGSYSSFR